MNRLIISFSFKFHVRDLSILISIEEKPGGLYAVSITTVRL